MYYFYGDFLSGFEEVDICGVISVVVGFVCFDVAGILQEGFFIYYYFVVGKVSEVDVVYLGER